MKHPQDPGVDHAAHITYDALHAYLADDQDTVGAAIAHLSEEHHDDGITDLSCLILLNVCAQSVHTRGAAYIRPTDMTTPTPYVNAVAAAVDHRWDEAGEHLGLVAHPNPHAMSQTLTHLLSLTRRCMEDQGTRMQR